MIEVWSDAGQRAYLKRVTDGSDRVRREAAALRVARRRGLRVPRVLAADPDASQPWLATARLPGVPLSARFEPAGGPARERLLERVGRELARIHERRFDAPGRITGCVQGEQGGWRPETTDESWPETLAATVERRGATLLADRFEGAAERLAGVLRASDALADAEQFALLHGDPNAGNCFLEPPGTIDWDRALVGDPGLEVVEAVSHLVEGPDRPAADEDRLREALFAGYRARAGALPPGFERRRPAYRAVALFLALQTFAEWAPAADEPVEELADWLHEAFDERLAAARDAG